MTPPRPLSIGIAGAGNAGLAAPIAFARQAHPAHVFEKHPQLTAMGAGLLIQPQGIRALEALGVGRELAQRLLQAARLRNTKDADHA